MIASLAHRCGGTPRACCCPSPCYAQTFGAPEVATPCSLRLERRVSNQYIEARLPQDTRGYDELSSSPTALEALRCLEAAGNGPPAIRESCTCVTDSCHLVSLEFNTGGEIVPDTKPEICRFPHSRTAELELSCREDYLRACEGRLLSIEGGYVTSP